MFKKIKKYFLNDYIKIYDNSIYHKNNGNKKHITILIVSNKFINQKLINRHRKIYQLLSQSLINKIYALAIYTYTISEWHQKKNIIKKNICHHIT